MMPTYKVPHLYGVFVRPWNSVTLTFITCLETRQAARTERRRLQAMYSAGLPNKWLVIVIKKLVIADMGVIA